MIKRHKNRYIIKIGMKTEPCQKVLMIFKFHFESIVLVGHVQTYVGMLEGYCNILLYKIKFKVLHIFYIS
jgi:hypothetical protein